MTQRQSYLHTLASQAVASPAWRWLPGMCFVDETGSIWRVQTLWHAEHVHSDRLPDLTDPATLGCVLSLVRGAHSGTCWTEHRPSEPWQGWVVWHDREDGRRVAIGHADTEAAALVAALGSAPSIARAPHPDSWWTAYTVDPGTPDQIRAAERARIAGSVRDLVDQLRLDGHPEDDVIDLLTAIAADIHDGH